MPRKAHRDPRTKEELLNAIISPTYDGDIRHLGDGAKLDRVSGNVVRLEFPASGNVYDLTIHKPRDRRRT